MVSSLRHPQAQRHTLLTRCLAGGVLTCCVVLMLLERPAVSEAQPVAFRSWDGGKTNMCRVSPEVETLCQRCAKDTKSEGAYPMCCEDREATFKWCEKYVNWPL